MSQLEEYKNLIQREGFAFVPAAPMRALLGEMRDWDAFAASWDDLQRDSYMADKGQYRKRRYGVYRAAAGQIEREQHQPHYQKLDYNALNGGIERWFEPILPELDAGWTLPTILKFCDGLFSDLGAHKNWHVEVHQFRIEAHSGEMGQPTPEGMHRDGVDYVLVLLVRRENIQSGVTHIEDTSQKHLDQFTLADACDAALVDDHRVLHGVTAVTPLDPARPAFRDVLVVTFRRQP